MRAFQRVSCFAGDFQGQGRMFDGWHSWRAAKARRALDLSGDLYCFHDEELAN
jgi:hypothetical protein